MLSETGHSPSMPLPGLWWWLVVHGVPPLVAVSVVLRLPPPGVFTLISSVLVCVCVPIFLFDEDTTYTGSGSIS